MSLLLVLRILERKCHQQQKAYFFESVEEDKRRKSQHLETPRGLVFVVQTVGGVEVEFPGRGRRLLFVIQTVRGVEGEPGRAVRLVVVRRVVVMVVVP